MKLSTVFKPRDPGKETVKLLGKCRSEPEERNGMERIKRAEGASTAKASCSQKLTKSFRFGRFGFPPPVDNPVDFFRLTETPDFASVSPFNDSSMQTRPDRPATPAGCPARIFYHHVYTGLDHEAYIPAQSSQAQEGPRLSQAYEHAWWASGHQASSAEGSQAPDGVGPPHAEAAP
jgi:hypothetical protein